MWRGNLTPSHPDPDEKRVANEEEGSSVNVKVAVQRLKHNPTPQEVDHTLEIFDKMTDANKRQVVFRLIVQVATFKAFSEALSDAITEFSDNIGNL